jgi:hypothetical protein
VEPDLWLGTSRDRSVVGFTASRQAAQAPPG